MNPIIVMRNVDYSEWVTSWQYCTDEGCGLARGAGCRQTHIKINMDNINNKIWLTNRLFVGCYRRVGSGITSALIPRIHQLDLEFLRLDIQILSYNDLKFLFARTVKEVCLYHCVVKDDDGGEAPFENFLRFLADTQNLFYHVYEKVLICSSYEDFVAACGNISLIKLVFTTDNGKNLFRSNIDSKSPKNTFDAVINKMLQNNLLHIVPPVSGYAIQSSECNKRQKIQENVAAKYQ